MRIIVFKGGLGNQLFQLCFYLYLKRRYKGRIYGYYKKCTGHNGLEVYRIFDKDIPESSILSDFIYQLMEKSGIFPISTDDHFNMKYLVQEGYWQDVQFLELTRMINFRNLLLEGDNLKLYKRITTDDCSVSVHIRRGDYCLPQFSPIYGNICDVHYYNEAIKIIKRSISTPVFYVFSDDINWAKSNLVFCDQVIFIDWNRGEKDYLDMYLMSFIRNHIIANSTFSYWAAILNGEKDIVIYPRKWYNSQLPQPKIFPNDWIGI
jgi:hypothetical protein